MADFFPNLFLTNYESWWLIFIVHQKSKSGKENDLDDGDWKQNRLPRKKPLSGPGLGGLWNINYANELVGISVIRLEVRKYVHLWQLWSELINGGNYDGK